MSEKPEEVKDFWPKSISLMQFLNSKFLCSYCKKYIQLWARECKNCGALYLKKREDEK